MKYLVTGGSGLVGSHVGHALAKTGNEMVVYDLAPDISAELKAEGHTFVRGDIRDAMSLMRAISECRPEAIVHLASALAVGVSPALTVEVNSIGMTNVLEAAAIFGIKRVVYASSAAVFAGLDPAAGLIRDDSPYAPTNVYGATKVLCEQLGRQYRQTRGVEAVGLRFTLMTGLNKGGASGTIGRELIQKPASGEPARVPWGDDLASWLWAGDAARAIVLAAESSDLPATEYNVGGDVRSVREAAAIVQALLPQAHIEVESGKFGLDHPFDTSRIERDLGFKWETPLEIQLETLIREAQLANAR